ncbi:SRPBCC family protein [Intrasporangium calvum]|uniref:Carbon monoxide dehydrogenase subunit G n=1 Tax=Intrasporangium calvum (strain ATCC 23552 / DSM 43043 / JCM 3097 / NBRC 12989 / NCIMB 10167 / NRRL B-3866 / 7 KIP) TaxID=710696 RepID=E6SDZ0_INTC7|nr:carbon monoxide dehydrogenase subunit G [Intrasporangium calvum]ADU47603.1 carbon monoxide dehydrogenase subunit G [Intrasporangium calvum DSM 43043]
MKITGTASLSADPLHVWDAIHDPAVLARALPGCQRLVEVGPNHYAMTVSAGVAAIKGTYDGEVRLLNPQHPESFTMKASGSGAPGTVAADVDVRVAQSEDGGTLVSYDADATVGGPIGGVGQRMLSGVTKKMAGQFFAALDAEIAGVPPELRAQFPAAAALGSGAAAGAGAGEPTPPGAGAPSGAEPSGIRPAGAVYAGKSTTSAESTRIKDFVLGTFTGAGIAFVGVLIGWAIGRG